MRVFGLCNDPKSWTNPFPEADTVDGIKGADGFIIALRGGDTVSGAGWELRGEATAGSKPNYFNAIPSRVRRIFFWLPLLPFLSVRWGRFGFYIGFKVFGFDSPAYKDWPGVNPREVYEGSLALTGFTFRFTTKLRTEQ